MTVIAALVQDGKVHMAADTGYQVGTSVTHGPHKVFTLPVGQAREKLVMGFEGDTGMAALTYAHLKPPVPPKGDDEREWHNWATKIAAVVVGHARGDKPNSMNDDGTIDGSCLLGFRGRLWFIVGHDAGLVIDPFAAIGSGGNLALGSLATLPGDLMPARDQLEAAIEVACRFDSGCAVTVSAGMRYEVV